MATSHSGAWSVGQRSETGYVREENQDRMVWIRARCADIFVVSDGMGGRAGGAIAAQMTVDMLNRQLADVDSLDGVAARLASAFRAANDAVYMRGQSSNPATLRMGATAVALLAAGDRVMLAHVGDSRAYLLNRRGALQRLTRDHSLVQRMVDARLLSEVEAASHPDASVLERAMGQAPQVEVEVSDWVRVHPGEACMLCSDGLCGYVSDDEIAAVMRSTGAAQETADALVRIALEHGGEDNVTVQVMRYTGGESPWQRWLARGAGATAIACLLAALGWLGIQRDWFGLRSLNRHAPATASSAVASVPSSSAAPSASPSPPLSSASSASLSSASSGSSASASRGELAPKSGEAQNTAARSPSGASASAAPAPSSSTQAALESRIATLDTQLRKEADDRRASEREFAAKLDLLRGRVAAVEARPGAARPASAAAAAHAPGATRPALTRKPAQAAHSSNAAQGDGASSQSAPRIASAPPPSDTARQMNGAPAASGTGP